MTDINLESDETLTTEDGITLEIEDAPTPDPVRLVFRARSPQSLVLDGVVASPPYTFDPCVKDAEDTVPFKLAFSDTEGVAIFWERDEQYDAGELIRPRRPNGYALQCAVGGFSGATEPPWPPELAKEVQDGSVKWVVVQKDSNGTAVLTEPTVTLPTGITVANLAVLEGTSLIGQYVGGENGKDFEAKFGFKVNGIPRVARQWVKARAL